MENIEGYRKENKDEVLRNALKTFMNEDRKIWVREGKMEIVQFIITN